MKGGLNQNFGGNKISWMDWFGFSKNPWVDTPLSGDSKELVETEKIGDTLSEFEKVFSNKQGDLRLLVGKRGMGKSTLLNVIVHKANSNPNTFGIKIDPYIPDIKEDSYLVATHIFKIIYDNLSEKIGLKGIGDYSVDNLKKVLKYYTHSKNPLMPVFCLDDLDKLDTEQDMDVISRFLKENQNLLQRLKINALVIISCSPYWIFLKSKDLSYLNYENRVQLERIKVNEVREIIEKRLKTISKKFEDVFVVGVITHLAKVSEGNPRTLLSRCMTLCKRAFDDKKERIDEELIVKVFGEEILQHITKCIKEISESSPYLNDGLVRIWRFNQELDIRELEPLEGFKILGELIKKPSMEKRKISAQFLQPLINSGCGSVIRDIDKNNAYIERFGLNKPVIDFFKEWKRHGFTFKEFAENYVAKPMRPRLSQTEVYIQQKITKYSIPKAKMFFSDSVKFYKEIKDDYQNKTYPDIVLTSWQIIEFFIKAELIHTGITPEIQCELRYVRHMGEYYYYCPSCKINLRGKETECPSCGENFEKYDKRRGLMKQLIKVVKDKRVFLSVLDEIDYCRKKRNSLVHSPRAKAKIDDSVAMQCRQNSIKAFEEFLRLL